MTTTDMNFMSNFDEYLPTGEMLLADWELDTSLLSNSVDHCATNVNKLQSAELMIENFLNDKHEGITDIPWMSECIDLSSTFEMMAGDSLEKLSSCKADHIPSSPDSGIGSPQSFCSSDVASPGSLSSECGSPINSAIHQNLPTVSEQDLEYLNRLWNNEDIPLDISPSLDITVTSNTIENICSTTSKAPTLNDNSTIYTLVSCPTQLATPVLPKPSTTPTKKMKSLSTKEKKERKRAQNKNAATRYREKKRSEAQTVESEMQLQDEKNRTLKDRVNQISREMQYLRDLLIEVYRTKGIIK